jgi:hypothetical protein
MGPTWRLIEKYFWNLDPYKHNLHISSGDDMFLLMAMQKVHS